MSDFDLLMKGYRITTAQIFYLHPDHPEIVNPNWFLWQQYDLPPRFPKLNRFLRWWDDSLDGKLHSVRVCVRGLIQPTDLKHLGHEFRLG